MEFTRGQVLLISQAGRFFDKAQIRFVEETGDGRILHMMNTTRTERVNYQIGEIRDEKWEVFTGKSLENARRRRDPDRQTLTLEIV